MLFKKLVFLKMLVSTPKVPKDLMMKATPDATWLRLDEQESQREDVADSEETSDVFDNESDATSAEQDVRQALERRAVTGSPATIAEMLAVSAPNTYGYWAEAALELHALKRHYDALDCWRQAKIMTDDGGDHNARYSMGYELWNASECGVDAYLAEEALRACVREDEWEGVACIRRAMGDSEEAVLDAMWKGLLARGWLQWDEWQIGADYCAEGYQWDEIVDWESMAATVFVRGDRPKAFEAWANGLKFDPKDADDKILRSAAGYLRHALRDAGYAEE